MTRAHTAAVLALATAAASLAVLSGPTPAVAQAKTKRAKRLAADPPPPGAAVKPSVATPADQLKVAKGFTVERLYSVPKESEGSWVNLCVDPKGRLIVSDQYGSLYRVTPPPVGQTGEVKIEKIPAAIGLAQGLLWAFDALYVVVNTGGDKAGLYRVTDANNDDMPDTVQLLRKFQGGGGEHGPHAVVAHPDGKRLTIVCGNQTKLTEVTSSRVPRVWGEDHLLPRLPDGNGFMKGVLAPGGCIYNVTPDGKDWELVSIGYRNEYDAAYNAAGDLFTYDADMEWDFNTPWYRPTRVCLVSSGSEYGWRNGAGKYPSYYPDNLPGIVDIGPGSPTGVCFGTGAKFPSKYQNALFICDWSYGKMYAVHMQPSGSAYQGTFEEFVTGTPFPLTDAIIGKDGAMYITTGGRRVQSGLYRVTYTGGESTDRGSATSSRNDDAARALRTQVEAFHGKVDPRAVAVAWPHLSSPDRFLRFAARVALEWQPADQWRDKALAEADPQAKAIALLALVRVSAADPQHATPGSPKPDPALRAKVLDSLATLDLAKLPATVRIDAARVYQVLFNRFGTPTAGERSAVLAKLNTVFPTGNRFVDGMLLEILVYLQDETVSAKAMKLLADAPTQEEQMEYVRSLRALRAGWTPELHKQYFEWFVRAAGYKGGNSFHKFLALIKADAVAGLSDAERVALKPTLEANPATTVVPAAAPRPFVRRWTLNALAPKVEEGLKAGGRNFDRGRKLFAAASCFACHRFDNEGGSNGPDLTGIAGRFSTRDLLEHVLDPNKEISDQYAAVEIDTLDGKKVVGRIINLNGENLMVNVNMLDPNGIVTVNRRNIDEMKPSKLSMMPAGLMDTLTEDEATDLMAYLLSRGDRASASFRK